MGGDGSFPAAGVTATHVMNQGPCDAGTRAVAMLPYGHCRYAIWSPLTFTDGPSYVAFLARRCVDCLGDLMPSRGGYPARSRDSRGFRAGHRPNGRGRDRRPRGGLERRAARASGQRTEYALDAGQFPRAQRA